MNDKLTLFITALAWVAVGIWILAIQINWLHNKMVDCEPDYPFKNMGHLTLRTSVNTWGLIGLGWLIYNYSV